MLEIGFLIGNEPSFLNERRLWDYLLGLRHRAASFSTVDSLLEGYPHSVLRESLAVTLNCLLKASNLLSGSRSFCKH